MNKNLKERVVSSATYKSLDYPWNCGGWSLDPFCVYKIQKWRTLYHEAGKYREFKHFISFINRKVAIKHLNLGGFFKLKERWGEKRHCAIFVVLYTLSKTVLRQWDAWACMAVTDNASLILYCWCDRDRRGRNSEMHAVVNDMDIASQNK